MRIKQIEFNNFRIYKGKNVLVFDLDDPRNITIVSGQNGYGKTTFLMGLVWCLYGKQMEKVDNIYRKEIQDKGGYSKYISGSLNASAASEGEREFSVSIIFQDINIPEITCREVKVKRSFNTLSGSADKAEILIDGYRNELIQDLTSDNQRGEEIFIRDYILPLEIAKFFFFDAEKIVALAEGNSQEERRDLSLAYSEVLGIKKYDDLRLTLESQRDEYRRSSATPEEHSDLIQLEADYEKLLLKITKAEKDHEQLDEERQRKQFDSNEVQNKLIKLGNRLTVEELEKLRSEEVELLKQKSEVSERLKEIFDLLPFAFSGGLLLEVQEQVVKEDEFRSSAFRKEEADLKVTQFLTQLENKKTEAGIMITDFALYEFYNTQIRELLYSVVYSVTNNLPPDFQPLHNFGEVEKSDLHNLISTLRLSVRRTYNEMTNLYNQNKTLVDGIRRKIRDAERDAEDDYTQSLRLQKDSIDRRIAEISSEIERLLIRKGELQGEVKTNRQRHSTLNKRIEVSKDIEAKDRKVGQLINELLEFSKRFKENKKRSLEEKIRDGLNTLMHKKDFIHKVSVDIDRTGEDVDINLYDDAGKLIDRGLLSMGERQMFASALLMALVDESDIEFPVFIDSPMQKFDERHAENIIRRFYPAVSKQVVILPLLNKELTTKEYNILKPTISHSYLIRQSADLNSFFEEIHPEDLLDRYNAIYNAN